MQIRGARTWCERCQAPEVFPENVPLVELFLDALPAYRVGGMGGGPAIEGFDRAAMPGLMALHRIAPADQPDAWDALREMETRFRQIRRLRADEEKARGQ